MGEQFQRVLEFYGLSVSEGGWRSSKAPCHDDTKNSFSYNTDLEGFCCYAGCGKGKGIIQLIKMIEGKDECGAVSRAQEILGAGYTEIRPESPGDARRAILNQGKRAYERNSGGLLSGFRRNTGGRS